MQYLDQSADNLMLTLVQGDLDISQFNVVAQEIADFGKLNLTLRIIGGSHVLSAKTKNQEFHEILACKTPLKEQPCLLAGKLLKVTKYQTLLSDNILYSFEAGKLTTGSGTCQMQAIEELCKQESDLQKGLVQVFPNNGKIANAPKTIVFAAHFAQKRQVRIKTVHSYPNEQNIVLTESIFDLNGGDSDL